MRLVSRWVVLGLLLQACSFSASRVAGDGPDAPGGDDDAPPGDDAPHTCDFVEVAGGTDHTCARTSGGDVWCWGKNTQGQIGVPVQGACAMACNITPVKVPGLSGMRGLGLGDQHSCAFSQTETYCWGANDSGQFGNNGSDAPAPLLITERANASAIAAGTTHTCSIHGGGVKCSGPNTHGEVGDGTKTARPTAVANSVASAATITVGVGHACVITGVSVYCWGQNDGGQVLGTTSPDVVVPTIVAGLATGAADIAGGAKHTCAALTNGAVQCWGKNDNGQLGLGDTAGHPGIQTAGVTGIVQVAAADDHTCARASGGTVYCWGTIGGSYPTPMAIALGRPAIDVTSGHDHSCAVLDDGTVWCWGADGFGQLGDGLETTNTGLTPVLASVCH